ncbi:sensor histidine kinase [Oceanobacillus kapialis]|uniref:histidine kinase n=1 Tax=Oceanobacillus kapialis TaxID=481353 RepID=A0ABW5PWF8_9BACI
MKTYRRFVIQFLARIFILFFLLAILLFTSFALLGYFYEQVESFEDLTDASESFIAPRVDFKEETAQFDQELKVLAEEQDRWMAVLTEKGDIVGSFHAPDNLQDGDIGTLLSQEESSITCYWEVVPFPTEEVYYVVLGTNNWQGDLLPQIAENVDWENHKLAVSEPVKPALKEHKGWAILVDRSGRVVDSYGEGPPASYQTADLLANNTDSEGRDAVNHFDQASQLTLVVGKSPAPSSLKANIHGTISNSVIVFTILLLLFLLLATFWYAHKFSSPLLTFMRWLQNIRQGVYVVPVDQRTGQSVLLNKHGNIKRKYRLYQDLIVTLTQLTTILKERETERVRTAKSREDWISGISHDLKTPLASIQGYANMMESPDYAWSETEIRDFATIIGEKSVYMKDLIEDLNITYQLKNNEIPMVKEKADVNECIRRSLLQFINNPLYHDKELIFQPEEQELITSIDQKWFQRVMDNLIANALKYNVANTVITVSSALIGEHLIVIKVTDDGVGMDQETMQHLFTRYYRGTNTTESVSGTGLGLAISKQLIELHDGSISVKSKPGEGTTIRILLPVL